MNREEENKEPEEESWQPSLAEEALTTQERSLDIGESGQFAPGGYYNQQGVNEPRRTMVEDDEIPSGRL